MPTQTAIPPTETPPPTPTPETRSDAQLAEQITNEFNAANEFPLTDLLLIPQKEGLPADFVMGFASQDNSLDFSQNPNALRPETANDIAVNTLRDIYNAAIGTQYTSAEFVAHMQAGDLQPVQFMIEGEEVEVDPNKGMLLVAGTPNQPGRVEYQLQPGRKSENTFDIKVINGRLYFIEPNITGMLNSEVHDIGLTTEGVHNRFYDAFSDFSFAPLWLGHVLDVQREKGQMQDILGPGWQTIRLTPGSWADSYSSKPWSLENTPAVFIDKKVDNFILQYTPPQGRHTDTDSAGRAQTRGTPRATLSRAHMM
ncbi:MAG TPA: hypothetical protein PK299_15925 [Anaerolineales bacterium]|nr:hypothetical protein [Anaerolineales bacterium]